VVSKLTLDMLYEKFGDELDDYWQTNFGHSIACLTEREAVAVSRQQSLVALNAIVASATEEVRLRRV
jgi:hypothetical protein